MTNGAAFMSHEMCTHHLSGSRGRRCGREKKVEGELFPQGLFSIGRLQDFLTSLVISGLRGWLSAMTG